MVTKTCASDVAFTRSVKAEQERRGSRGAYARMERGEGWATTITDDLRDFVAARDSFYLATANADGQPYIQHRGGPPGFVKVLDEKTLAFADFAGNKQYITLGNLKDNDRAFLFFMDYARRQRIKVWGRARVVEGDAELLARVMRGVSGGGKARGERVIVFTVTAWDVNCPQHIPQKLDATDVREAMSRLEGRVRELEMENAALRAELVSKGVP
jgi:uncharacterized protein